MKEDWERVIGYVTQAHEDQRRAEDFLAQARALDARAHLGRVMAKKLIDMKLGGSGRALGGSAPDRDRRLGGEAGEAGGAV